MSNDTENTPTPATDNIPDDFWIEEYVLGPIASIQLFDKP